MRRGRHGGDRVVHAFENGVELAQGLAVDRFLGIGAHGVAFYRRKPSRSVRSNVLFNFRGFRAGKKEDGGKAQKMGRSFAVSSPSCEPCNGNFSRKVLTMWVSFLIMSRIYTSAPALFFPIKFIPRRQGNIMAEPETQRQDGDKLYTLSEISQRTGISMPTLQRYKKSTRTAFPPWARGASSVIPRTRCRFSMRSRTKTRASGAVRARTLPLPVRSGPTASKRRPGRPAKAAAPAAAAALPSAREAARPPSAARGAAKTASTGTGRRPGRPSKKAAAAAAARPRGRAQKSGNLLTLTQISEHDRHFLSHPGALRPHARRSSAARRQGPRAAFLSAGRGRVPPVAQRERAWRTQEGLGRWPPLPPPSARASSGPSPAVPAAPGPSARPSRQRLAAGVPRASSVASDFRPLSLSA